MRFKNFEDFNWFFSKRKTKGVRAKGLYTGNFIRLVGNFGLDDYKNAIDEELIDEQDEVVFVTDIQVKGMALLLGYLEKKHEKPLNIKIIDRISNLENALKKFSEQPEGSKLTALLRFCNHWSTIHCERRNDKNHIAILDPLGFCVINIHLIDQIFKTNSQLKNNSIIYKPIQNVQFDNNNCGIIALKFAMKSIAEASFFCILKEGNLLISREEAQNYLLKQKILLEPDQQDINIEYFILPPKYYSLHQRKKYLKFYEEDFGERKGIHEFSHQSKSGKVMTLEDIFNREDRQQELAKYEAIHYESFSITKHDVLHFAAKYIKHGILDVLRTETKETIDNIVNNYIITNDNFLSMEPNIYFKQMPQCQLLENNPNSHQFFSEQASKLEKPQPDKTDTQKLKTN